MANINVLFDDGGEIDAGGGAGFGAGVGADGDANKLDEIRSLMGDAGINEVIVAV